MSEAYNGTKLRKFVMTLDIGKFKKEKGVTDGIVEAEATSAYDVLTPLVVRFHIMLALEKSGPTPRVPP